MKRIAGYFLLVTLLSLPAQAIGPLAFMAKDLVKGIVKNFVDGQVNQMLASAGPCGTSIARPGALTGLSGMLGERGAMPGLSSIPDARSFASAKAAGGMPGMGGAELPPDMAKMMQDQMARAQTMATEQMGVPQDVSKDATDRVLPNLKTHQRIQSVTNNAIPTQEIMTTGFHSASATALARAPDSAEATGLPQTEAYHAVEPEVANRAALMEKAMAAMQDPTPLSSTEVDELGTLLEHMSAAMPSAAPQCKPGELKMVIQQASDSPMTGGVLRMMLGSMRDMQKKLDEARDTFAKMPETERSEYVETMAAEFRGWDKENKQALLGMVENNFLGMPDMMKTQLLARLKQAK